jgi:hypothetical protein
MKNDTSDKNTITADRAMLLDESFTPALHSLIRLQERPVFQMDDKERPFAMINDLEYSSREIRAKDAPLTISESKPN